MKKEVKKNEMKRQRQEKKDKKDMMKSSYKMKK